MSDGVRKLSVKMWGLYATHQGQPPVDNGRRIADEPPAGVGGDVCPLSHMGPSANDDTQGVQQLGCGEASASVHLLR
jgi:hypothetical protein